MSIVPLGSVQILLFFTTTVTPRGVYCCSAAICHISITAVCIVSIVVFQTTVSTSVGLSIQVLIFRQYADASSTPCRLACLLLNCNQQPGASPTYKDLSYHSSLAGVILQQYCCLFKRDIFRPHRCLVTTVLISVSFAIAARVG